MFLQYVYTHSYNIQSIWKRLYQAFLIVYDFAFPVISGGCNLYYIKTEDLIIYFQFLLLLILPCFANE